MSAQYNVEQALKLVFLDVQQENLDSDEEVEDVSEEEDVPALLTICLFMDPACFDPILL